MTRKLSVNQIARDLGEELSRRLISGTIRDLQKMRDTLLSGEHSGLQSVWEEVCVQQQLEESIYWSAYLEVIDTFIGARLDELKVYEREALWLLTNEADDWDSEDEDQRDKNPVSFSDILNDLRDELLSAACDWSNARIIRYRERAYRSE